MILGLLRKKTPLLLYKYITLERWDVVQNFEVRFTQFEDLNDPFETKNIQNITEWRSVESFATLKRQHGYYGNSLAGWTPDKLYKLNTLRRNTELERKQYLNESLPSLGILSLAAQPDNLLLWAHYADNHRGIVIALETTDRFFSADYAPKEWYRSHPALFRLRNVRYAGGVPRLACEVEKSLEAAVFTKSKHWRYEEEWRMCRPIAEATRTIEKVPFPVCLFAVPFSAIRAVYFGCRVPDEIRTKLILSLPKTPQYEHLRFFRSRINQEKFAVIFEKVRE